MKFSFQEEKNGKLSFLDIEVSREGKQFVTIVYRKPTFSDVYAHFDSFLPTAYKFGIIYTLVFRSFKIFSNWTNFHNELAYLKETFLKNGYLISLIDKCFKTVLEQLYLKRPQVSIAEKKTSTFVFPFLENCPFKPGQNFKKFSKEHQVVVKSRQFSKIKEISQTFSILKILYLTTLCLVLCINFSVEDAMLPIMVKLTGT